MVPVFVDWETYYDKDYSLSKTTPLEYVLDPRFQEISCAIRVGRGLSVCHFGHDAIHTALMAIDWSDKILVGHNMSGFDALIAAWHHNLNPRLWGCTLAMARPVHAAGPGESLKALATHYKLPPKGELRTLGKRLEDLTQQERLELAVYNKQDTDLCAMLWEFLRLHTSNEELFLIDRTIRMLVEPRFVADVPLLEKGLAAERQRKLRDMNILAQRLGVSVVDLQTELSSSAKFVGLLRGWGVEVPTKISPTTNKAIPAVAKTDLAMQDLLEHSDSLVQAAAALRLDTKSTLLEARLERLITFAKLCDGRMPMPLKYYGAATGRWSGDFKVNVQNLPRVDRSQPHKLSNILRMSLCAPPGQQVVVVDLSGIELRVNHFLWKVPSSMALFRADPEKADLYKDFAARLYEVPVAKVDKPMRHMGKLAQLGLGYGAAAATFQRIAKTMGGVTLGQDQAETTVKTWRDTYPEIVTGWRLCEVAITAMHRGLKEAVDPWGLCVTDKNCIRTPKGVLRYPDLRQEYDPKMQRQGWVYGQGRNKAKIYGAKFTENIIQSLARFVLTDTILAFARTPLGRKYPLVHCVHDELVYMADEADAPAVLAQLKQHMIDEPKWWPELITWAEGDIAPRYGLAK